LNLLHTCLGLTTTGATSTSSTNFLFTTWKGFHPYSRVHL